MSTSPVGRALGLARGAVQTLLKRDTPVARENRRPVGRLPDFVILGTQKGGTTSLYDLLVQHPLVAPTMGRSGVRPTDVKELHFFDLFYDRGVEWYRERFPEPSGRDGRMTVTGEATPYYMFHPRVPERMAEVVPEARLIVLLRDPVDRAYSHYQQEARRGSEELTFEEAIEAEPARLDGAEEKLLGDEHHVSFEHQHFSYLSRGLYADQLARWARYFPGERTFVAKSEEFFERPADVVRRVVEFLGLPPREPEDSQLRLVRNPGGYEQEMDGETRRRLESYFAPHNRKLYDYLGVDFGW